MTPRLPGPVQAANANDEARPLLSASSPARRYSNAEPSAISTHGSLAAVDESPRTTLTRCSWPWLYVVAMCIGMAVVSDIGECLFVAPRIRLFESVICTSFYRDTDPSVLGPGGEVPEKLCKIDPVQDQVASLLGWQYFFDSLPAILLPLPYGYLADKNGRKWLITLSLLGVTLSYAWTLVSIGVLHLPLQYVWLSSLFFLIGGGPTTGTTLLTTVIADVVPPNSRSTAFFYRFCTDLIAELFLPPVTGSLMRRNIWIPLIGAVVFQALSILLTLPLPETLPRTIPGQDGMVSGHGSDTDVSSDPDEEFPTKTNWRKSMRETLATFDFATRDAVIASLVLTFLISKVGRQSNNILFQYVSKRYGWELSQAALLMSLRAAVNIILFVAILPAIANFAFPGMNAVARDLLTAKGSIVFLIVGALAISLSASPVAMCIGLVLFTLGMGFPPLARSLATSLVEARHPDKTSDIGRLYALISVMEGIGSVLAAPGMALAFRWGISLGGPWLGAPFGLAAVLFALVSVIVFSIRI